LWLKATLSCSTLCLSALPLHMPTPPTWASKVRNVRSCSLTGSPAGGMGSEHALIVACGVDTYHSLPFNALPVSCCTCRHPSPICLLQKCPAIAGLSCLQLAALLHCIPAAFGRLSQPFHN
jgi:hypothetical protein